MNLIVYDELIFFVIWTIFQDTKKNVKKSYTPKIYLNVFK